MGVTPTFQRTLSSEGVSKTPSVPGQGCVENAQGKTATVWVCFEKKHKQDRKHLVYLTMLLIFNMERQGTLVGLKNPAQTKITQTSAFPLFLPFLHSQKGWKLILGEGPHLCCPDLQRQSSKNNILGWVPGEGRWGFVVRKSWQPRLWSVKIYLHPLHIYWLVFTPCPLWRIIYSNSPELQIF